MIKYETPKIDIAYFGDTVNTSAANTASTYSTAAYNQNAAAVDGGAGINAAAVRTTRLETILNFQTQ